MRPLQGVALALAGLAVFLFLPVASSPSPTVAAFRPYFLFQAGILSLQTMHRLLEAFREEGEGFVGFDEDGVALDELRGYPLVSARSVGQVVEACLDRPNDFFVAPPPFAASSTTSRL